ncbi:MAG: NUDIX hydrolase [Promethearchaeota archaeon]
MDTLNLRYNELLIKEQLLSFDSPSRLCINDDFFTKAAVLFTIIPYDENPYELVIIHRTDKGLKHRGEMSFPGGKFDLKLDKSLRDTALRECEEEIGVPRNKIKILGCLHDFPTMTQYIITPFVGVINKNQELIKDEREVQDIIKVPINFFTEKRSFKEKVMDIGGKPFPVFFLIILLIIRIT